MILTTLLLLQTATIATHAGNPVACPTKPAPMPSGWAAMTPMTAGASSETATTPPLGRGVRATLRPAESVKLAVSSTRPTATGSSSGLFAFDAPAAGRYRIVLDAGVWVDVVAHGVALTSVAHSHGPACSPIKKQVDFDLKPGRYLLQVVGSTAPTLAVMVSRMNGGR